MRINTAFDTSKELLIQRYKQGIRLVRPCASAEHNSKQSIGSVFNLPIQIYFNDHSLNLLDVNSTQLEMLGASTLKDVQGKSSDSFFKKELLQILLKNHSSVISAAQMRVLEEDGELVNGPPVQTLSIKFPWYQNEKIIGLFGCSINIDPNHISNFGNAMAQLMTTGLLGNAPATPTAFLPELKDGNIYFSKRECEVLRLLVRGKTAKEIGQVLQISKRTAENHIKNAKTKANCASKSELIDKFVDQFI